jgi:hypothetical protein
VTAEAVNDKAKYMGVLTMVKHRLPKNSLSAHSPPKSFRKILYVNNLRIIRIPTRRSFFLSGESYW